MVHVRNNASSVTNCWNKLKFTYRVGIVTCINDYNNFYDPKKH